HFGISGGGASLAKTAPADRSPSVMTDAPRARLDLELCMTLTLRRSCASPTETGPDHTTGSPTARGEGRTRSPGVRPGAPRVRIRRPWGDSRLSLDPGRMLGPYRILERIGAGGM